LVSLPLSSLELFQNIEKSQVIYWHDSVYLSVKVRVDNGYEKTIKGTFLITFDKVANINGIRFHIIDIGKYIQKRKLGKANPLSPNIMKLQKKNIYRMQFCLFLGHIFG